MKMDGERRPRLAVWKFASCDGCQLSLLDCENELLDVAGEVEIAYFPEASSAYGKGPYDISLVEGSISTPHDAERIHRVRRASRVLIAIGACATAGGIQSLRNFRDARQVSKAVYAQPQYLETLTKSTPVADHVFVDYELRGCPINKMQLLEVLVSLLHRGEPRLPTYSVCMECKRKGAVCVMVAEGAVCMGPVTQAGCGALCPTHGRGCYGCFGPKETPNCAALGNWWKSNGIPEAEIVRAFRTFNAYAEPFRREGEAHEQPNRQG